MVLFNRSLLVIRSQVENTIGILRRAFLMWRNGPNMKTHEEAAMALRATAVVHNMRANWSDELGDFLPWFHNRKFGPGEVDELDLGDEFYLGDEVYENQFLFPDSGRPTNEIILEHTTPLGFFPLDQY